MYTLSKEIRSLYNEKGYWKLRLMLFGYFWENQIKQNRKYEYNWQEDEYFNELEEIKLKSEPLSEDEKSTLKDIIILYKKFQSFGQAIEDEEIIKYLNEKLLPRVSS